ncbi:MAG: hypothetical protein HY900_25180 [Deltaproteobacteria bacterium]|nr:hypothetical protein [Deltaproteobacteria bacterium]
MIVVAVLILALPLPVAERYTSPTQDGQYLSDPLRAYRFVIAAATVSPSSVLNTSGEALARAKELFADTELRPNKVELLFLDDSKPYEYLTEGGQTLYAPTPGQFIWEVWGVSPGDSPDGPGDVVALLDYDTGELLASTE